MQSNLYKVLDDLRQIYGISVSDFCKGVIDERTYYRYLSKDSTSSLSRFLDLLHTANIPLVVFLIYALHFRNDTASASFLRFIYRAHRGKYDDILPHYNNLKNNPGVNQHIAQAVNAYILRYEYDTNALSKEEYIKKLDALIATLPEEFDILTIFAHFFRFEMKENPTNQEIKRFYTFIDKHDFKLSPLFSLNLYDLYLDYALRNPHLNVENLQEVYDKLATVVAYFPNRYYLGKKYLFQAFLAYINKNLDYKELLIKYYVNAVLIYSPKVLERNIATINTALNIDVLALVKEAMLSK